MTEIVDKWVAALGISHIFSVDVTYDTQPSPENTDTCTVRAITQPMWEYLEAKMRFYLPAIVDLTVDQLEELVVHELLHIYVNELAMSKPKTDEDDERHTKHEERVVVQLARSIIKVRNAARAEEV